MVKVIFTLREQNNVFLAGCVLKDIMKITRGKKESSWVDVLRLWDLDQG